LKKSYLDFAEGKYKLIQVAVERNFYDDALAILCFETVERYLKHLIQLKGKVPGRTHNLKSLALEIGDRQLKKRVEPLQGVYFERNYPGDEYYVLEQEEYEEFIEIVEEVRKYTFATIDGLEESKTELF
jgi:HEPN domain-containing protein